MTNFDDLKFSVEALSGGTNTVRLDDLGMPSVLVAFPKLKYADVITGGTQDTLPAFIVDGVEKDLIYISKYQNIIVNDRAYSLPFKDPAAVVNFDRALQVCRNKGQGWHLLTNAAWAAVALWSRKNGTMPRGNNNYGQDHTVIYEKGIPTYKYYIGETLTIGRTATGSGPVSWYHNYNNSGIADLNGNVWEWCGGFRLNNGEIQIIPDGNAMKSTCDMSPSSADWRAVMQDGTLVNPGTANTLKWDWVANKITLSTTITTTADIGRSTPFETLALASGVSAPTLLKALGLYPDGTGYEGDNVYINNSGERLLACGGSFGTGLGAGVFAPNLNYLRSSALVSIGFRSGFYE